MTQFATRSSFLDEANKIVNQDRNLDYASPESNFQDIADMTNVYLRGRENPAILPHDTAIMQIIVKICRIKQSPGKRDHWTDIAGYAACGGSVVVQESTAPADEPQMVAQRSLGVIPHPRGPEHNRIPSVGDIVMHTKKEGVYEVLVSVANDIRYRDVHTGVEYTKHPDDWLKPNDDGSVRYKLLMRRETVLSLQR